MTRVLRNLVPVLFTLGLLALIATFVDLEAIARQITGLDPLMFVAAAVAMLANVTVASLRYKIILQELAPASRPRLTPLIQLNLLTLFSSHILPFGAAADGLRAAVSWPLLKIKPTTAIEGVVADRALALVGFVVLGLIVLPLQFQGPWERQLVALQGITYAGATALFVLGGFVVFRVSGTILNPLLARLAGVATRLYGFVASVRDAATQLAIAAASVIFFAIMLDLLAEGLGLALPFWVALAVAPSLYLSQVIPIFYVGFGSRELAMSILLPAGGFMSASDAVALSLAVGLCNFIVSLPGAIFAWPFLRNFSWQTDLKTVSRSDEPDTKID